MLQIKAAGSQCSSKNSPITSKKDQADYRGKSVPLRALPGLYNQMWEQSMEAPPWYPRIQVQLLRGNFQRPIYRSYCCKPVSLACTDGLFQEGQTNITTLQNDNPTAVNILLLHFYRLFMTSDELADYTEDYESFDGFQTIIELVQVADKYGAIGLIPICELTLEDQFGRRVFSHFNHGEDCVQLSRMFLSTIFNNDVFDGMQSVKRGAARYIADAYKFCGSRRGELNELLGESSELRMMVLDALSAEAAWSR